MATTGKDTVNCALRRARPVIVHPRHFMRHAVGSVRINSPPLRFILLSAWPLQTRDIFSPFVHIITSPGDNSCTELTSVWALVIVIRHCLLNFYSPDIMLLAHCILLLPLCHTSCDVPCVFAVFVSLRDTTVLFVDLFSTSTSISPVDLLIHDMQTFPNSWSVLGPEWSRITLIPHNDRVY